MSTMAALYSNLSPTLDQLNDRIMQLPRELRDMIWKYTVAQDGPINITKSTLQFNVADTTILAELREAAYTHNTLVVTFPTTFRTQGVIAPPTWGAYPEYKHHIRTLVVEEMEPWTPPRIITNLLPWEREQARRTSPLRQQWLDLLDLPHLESLTINMQKHFNTSFGWHIYTPILLHLRSSLPNLHFTFNISFDDLLKPLWDSETWDLAGSTVPLNESEYDPMGYVDITELFQQPSKEDREYVAQHCQGRREVAGRDAMRGLVYENKQDRRMLAMHYVVKEPELLRVMVDEHYEVYRRVAEEMGEGTE
jgi:hypothetical protein